MGLLILKNGEKAITAVPSQARGYSGASVGIDPSTMTGLSCVHWNQVEHRFEVATHDLATLAKADTSTGLARAEKIAHQVVSFVQASRDLHGAVDVLIEDYGYSNANTLVTLVEISTLIRFFLLKQPGIKLWKVPPNVMKLFITGKGNAKKELVMKEAFKRFGYDHDDNNVTDAHCLATMVCARAAGIGYKNYPLPKAHWAALSKIVPVE